MKYEIQFERRARGDMVIIEYRAYIDHMPTAREVADAYQTSAPILHRSQWANIVDARRPGNGYAMFRRTGPGMRQWQRE